MPHWALKAEWMGSKGFDKEAGVSTHLHHVIVRVCIDVSNARTKGIPVGPVIPGQLRENLQKAALNGHSQQTASQKSGKKSKPWKKKKLQFYSEDVSGQVHLVLANGIYVEKENLQPRLQNTLRRMAAYSNPQYYKNHAMGFSNRDNPRIVACFEELIR